MSRARSLSSGSWLVERTAVACMEQQPAKMRGAAPAGLGSHRQITDCTFKIPPSIPGRWLPSGDASILRGGPRVGSNRVHVQAWLTPVLEDLGGEHPVSPLPSCGLCDALVLVLLESLKNLDTALCKNKCVAFHA